MLMMAERVFSPKEALPAPMTVMVVGRGMVESLKERVRCVYSNPRSEEGLDI
jgi:hypothetical protein